MAVIIEIANADTVWIKSGIHHEFFAESAAFVRQAIAIPDFGRTKIVPDLAWRSTQNGKSPTRRVTASEPSRQRLS